MKKITTNKPIKASLQEHRLRQNCDGLSDWYVNVYGKRRKVQLQEYHCKLFLFGTLFHGERIVLEFEEPLESIIEKVGHPTTLQPTELAN